MQPSMEALVRAQGKFLDALVGTLGALCDDEEVQITDEDYGREIEHIFAEMDKLSITSESK